METGPRTLIAQSLWEGVDMEYWFSAHETAQLAATVEDKGAAFYRRLGSAPDNATVRNLCEFFAQQEEEHRQTFRSVADCFRNQTVEFCYSVDIHAMLRTSLRELEAHFAHPGDARLDGAGVVDCLGLARRIEETSIRVYRHMSQTYAGRFSAASRPRKISTCGW